MSTALCPFWCLAHDSKRDVTLRDSCESRPVVLQHGSSSITLRLVRPAGRSLAVVEVAVGAQVARVPVSDVQALMNALRVLVGDAQRSGTAS